MSSHPQVMTARDYIQILIGRWYVVVATVILAVVAAVVSENRSAESYRAEARVVTQAGLGAEQTDSRKIGEQIEVVRSPAVVEIAMAAHPELGDLPSPSVDTPGTSTVLRIRVTGSDPDRAADMANAYAEAYLSYSDQIMLETSTTIEARSLELADVAAGLVEGDPRADAIMARRAALAGSLAEIDVMLAEREATVRIVRPATPPGPIGGSETMERAAAAAIVGLIAGLVMVAVIEIFRPSRRRDTRPSTADGAADT